MINFEKSCSGLHSEHGFPNVAFLWRRGFWSSRTPVRVPSARIDECITFFGGSQRLPCFALRLRCVPDLRSCASRRGENTKSESCWARWKRAVSLSDPPWAELLGGPRCRPWGDFHKSIGFSMLRRVVRALRRGRARAAGTSRLALWTPGSCWRLHSGTFAPRSLRFANLSTFRIRALASATGSVRGCWGAAVVLPGCPCGVPRGFRSVSSADPATPRGAPSPRRAGCAMCRRETVSSAAKGGPRAQKRKKQKLAMQVCQSKTTLFLERIQKNFIILFFSFFF